MISEERLQGCPDFSWIFSCRRKIYTLVGENSKCKKFGLRPCVFDPEFWIWESQNGAENEKLREEVRVS
jgi:hypothetical protein